MRGVLVHATLNECSMYGISVFIEPQISPLLHARLFWLVINIRGIWEVQHSFAFSFFCKFSLDISSLLLWWLLLSGNLLMCCKYFSTHLFIIFKYLMEFSSYMFGGFSQGISYLLWWSFYVVELFLKIHILLI